MKLIEKYLSKVDFENIKTYGGYNYINPYINQYINPQAIFSFFTQEGPEYFKSITLHDTNNLLKH